MFFLITFVKQTESLSDTAPETWDGGMYSEKADVFSLGLILWQLFGSARQNRKVITSRFPEDNDYNYLKLNGKFLLPILQRDIIRKVCVMRICFVYLLQLL